MYLKDDWRGFFTFIILLCCASSYAFDFDLCKTSLKDVLNDTNELHQYGTNLNNSREALINTNRYKQAGPLGMASMMVPAVRSSAFNLFTIGVFYDSLDFTKFNKKNAQNLYTYRIKDFYSDIQLTLDYMERVAPLIEDTSSRDDMKKIAMELRKLKAEYRYCE